MKVLAQPPRALLHPAATQINTNKHSRPARPETFSSSSSPLVPLLLAVLALRRVLDIKQSGEAEHLQPGCRRRALCRLEIRQEKLLHAARKQHLVGQKQRGKL